MPTSVPRTATLTSMPVSLSRNTVATVAGEGDGEQRGEQVDGAERNESAGVEAGDAPGEGRSAPSAPAR